jgi:hypothetical protein
MENSSSSSTDIAACNHTQWAGAVLCWEGTPKERACGGARTHTARRGGQQQAQQQVDDTRVGWCVERRQVEGR